MRGQGAEGLAVVPGERGAASGHMQGPYYLGIEIARIVREQPGEGLFGGCGIPDAKQEIGPASTSGTAQERGAAFFSFQCRRALGGVGIGLDGLRTELRVQGIGCSLLPYRPIFGNLDIRPDGVHTGLRMQGSACFLFPYCLASGHLGIRCDGLHLDAGDRTAWIARISLPEQGLRLACAAGAGQQSGQLVAGDRIAWIVRISLPEQGLCLRFPSLVRQEPGELDAEHGVIRQAANRFPVNGLGDVGMAEMIQGAAAQIPGVTIVRGPAQGVARPGEGMARCPGQHRLAQVAGGTDEEIGVAGSLGIVLQICEQLFGLGQDRRPLIRQPRAPGEILYDLRNIRRNRDRDRTCPLLAQRRLRFFQPADEGPVPILAIGQWRLPQLAPGVAGARKAGLERPPAAQEVQLVPRRRCQPRAETGQARDERGAGAMPLVPHFT